MPPGTILQLMVGIVALALLWTTWWFKRNDANEKKINDIDKEIDNANDAHSLFKLFNKLRNR